MPARHRAARRRAPVAAGGTTVAAVVAVLLVVLGSPWLAGSARGWSSGGLGAERGLADRPVADRGDPTFETGGTGADDWEQATPRVRAPVTSLVSLRLDETAHRLPADSGSGRRVVFSQSRQRVWLVDDAGRATRTYLVSGSAYDNLQPGRYAVYSRSEQAWGIGESGTMRWFVRFTTGPAGGAIGFHDIPVDAGEAVQSTDQLGTPLSHGCIRQSSADALALWDFADLGTVVVVVT